MFYTSFSARRHVTPALLASAITTGQLYKGLYWNADGIADVVDSYGATKKIYSVKGGTYPVQSYGVVTGGNTTLSAGDFAGLYD